MSPREGRRRNFLDEEKIERIDYDKWVKQRWGFEASVPEDDPVRKPAPIKRIPLKKGKRDEQS